MTSHSIDALYEREVELEDDYFVLTADVSIDFEYLAGGGNGWDEPRYGTDVEFVKANMLMGRKWVPAPKYIREWAIEWLRGDGHETAIQKAEDDRQPDPDRARDERWDDRKNDSGSCYQEAA